VYALPTQFFIGPDGIIRDVIQGPLDEAGATAEVEAILPGATASGGSSASTSPTASPSPGASPSAAPSAP
jgi:hypothetical protein